MTTDAKSKDMILGFKVTRPNGRDFRTDSVDYAAACAAGLSVRVEDAEPANGHVCGRGLHVSPTARKTIQFAERDIRPWRYWKGHYFAADLIESDEDKSRVWEFWPTREIFLTDIFGADFAERIEKVRADAATWKNIPWLKPTAESTDEAITALAVQWRAAIEPWRNGRELPMAVKVLRDMKQVDVGDVLLPVAVICWLRVAATATS